MRRFSPPAYRKRRPIPLPHLLFWNKRCCIPAWGFPPHLKYAPKNRKDTRLHPMTLCQRRCFGRRLPPNPPPNTLWPESSCQPKKASADPHSHPINTACLTDRAGSRGYTAQYSPLTAHPARRSPDSRKPHSTSPCADSNRPGSIAP